MNQRCILGAIGATVMAICLPMAVQAQQSDSLTLLCRGVTRLIPQGPLGQAPVATSSEDMTFNLDFFSMTGIFNGHAVHSRQPAQLRVQDEFYELDWNGTQMYLGQTVKREYITIGRYTGTLSHHILQLADGRSFKYIQGGQCERARQRF